MAHLRSAVLFEIPAHSVGRRGLYHFAVTLQEQVAGGRAFTCLITSDERMRQLNRAFRKRDYPADVLSFPSARADSWLGDIAVSFDRAREQAQERGHSVFDELRILMLHGVLHLAGFDHERDRGEMEHAERRWRRSLALPGSLIARSRA